MSFLRELQRETQVSTLSACIIIYPVRFEVYTYTGIPENLSSVVCRKSRGKHCSVPIRGKA